MVREVEDPRLIFRPLKLFLELAALALGAALIQFRPGSGALLILDWPRLLLLAAPGWAALVAAERWFLRGYRAERRGSYPSLFSVLVVGFALSVWLVAVVNGALPSAARTLRPEVRGVYALEFRARSPLGQLLPGLPGRASGEGEAQVASWRVPGEDLFLPLDAPAFAAMRPGAPLEVREQAGFLGVPYVAAVRWVR